MAGREVNGGGAGVGWRPMAALLAQVWFLFSLLPFGLFLVGIRERILWNSKG